MATAPPPEVAAALARVHRDEWGRVLAATARVTRDLDLAEECTQDAFERALERWPADGIPRRPGAWLTTVAGNRARDVVRREAHARRLLPMLVVEEDDPTPYAAPHPVPDDRLRLVFTCCHPSLAPEAQVALTLRFVCGLSTADVARAFLVQESTMAARLTRAKKKIAAARIPYRVPAADELPTRLGPVLDVVHLVYTTGHAAPTGDVLVRVDLVEVAVSMGRMLHQLLPRETAVTGLLALMLLGEARRSTRIGPAGELVLLAEQDRSRWDRDLIEKAASLVAEALSSGPPDPFTVEAAIAAVHAEAPSWEQTDWSEIVGLYDVLDGLRPTSVVRLNRAVAIGFRDGPDAGLAALAPLLEEPGVAIYPYVSAVRADLLRRLEAWDEAAVAYEEAITLTGNEVERSFLQARLAEARGHGRE